MAGTVYDRAHMMFLSCGSVIGLPVYSLVLRPFWAVVTTIVVLMFLMFCSFDFTNFISDNTVMDRRFGNLTCIDQVCIQVKRAHQYKVPIFDMDESTGS